MFGTIVVANFLTLLIGGLDVGTNGLPIYLLEGKNAIALTTLPTIPIVYLYSYTIHKKMKTLPLLLILICSISIYLSDSGTGIMVSFLTILFIFLPKKVFPTFKTYLYIYIVIFFTIIVFRLQELLFGDFIINVLHKDMTFTGRTYIWDVVLNVIKESWILGFGGGNDIISYYFFNLNETHNAVLEILMYSGLLGILFFLIILFVVGNKLSINKDHIISKILSFSIFAYMILGLTESVFYKKEFWILLIISYSVGNIIKSTDTDQNNLSKPSKKAA
ncbi:O-antigen ligase family protein [Bacillus nitratireducens]|uniref:O-antigen ligase family protein n=1 Tax=Bacillus nitratireducens TaxID=2026193 RepID=UPI0039BF8DF9